MEDSATQTEDWKAQMKKWDQPLEVTLTTTKDDLSEYLDTKLYQYVLYETSDDNLWDLFKDDFKNFTRATFNRFNRTELQRLRAVLRCGGVYVQQNTNTVTIAQSLLDVLNEDEQHKWTDADIEEARRDLQKGPVLSVFISLEEGNKRLQPLVF